jgi:hypothetical protein
MLRKLLHGRIKAFERRFGYDMAYGHEMLDVRLPAFLRFWQAAQLVQYTDGVPTAALFAARIATAMAEDCGPCAQLVVTMAEKAAVPATTLRAIVAGDPNAMDEDVRLAWRFTRATLAHDAVADELRDQIVARWGARAVVTLALNIAGTRIFPTIKYAMGHGKMCQKVRVGGGEVAPMKPIRAA